MLRARSTMPTGPLTKGSQLPWDGIEDALDELSAPRAKSALLQKTSQESALRVVSDVFRPACQWANLHMNCIELEIRSKFVTRSW